MLAVALSLALALVLLVSAGMKLAAGPEGRAALASYGIRDESLASVVWAALGAIEAGLAVGLIAGAEGAAWATAALFTVFCAAQGVALVQGRGGAPCGCFGAKGRVSSASVGRAALLAVGAGVVVVCGWQTWIALRGGFSDSLETGDAGRALRRTVTWVGTVGILARAAVAAPIGVLMVLAAVRSQAGDAMDLDQLLAGLNHSSLGHALVWVIAGGFLVFAGYSLLEARYRTVHAGN